MRQPHAARDTTPQSFPLEAAPDLPVIRMPTRALTADGFRAWMASESTPPGVRISYVGDGVEIECEETGVRLHIPASAATLDGFCEWMADDDSPDIRHVSFLDPEILIDMSREEIETHVKLKTMVTAALAQLVEELDSGEFLGDGVLYSQVRAGLANAPDASFVKWETSESGRVRLIDRRRVEGHITEIQGPPDWVMEVVSQSSVGKDTRDLRIRYRRAGIPEYWLIDARGADIRLQMLVLRGNRYVAVRPRDGWYVSPVFGRAFRLERNRNRAGRWQYKLRHQPA